MTPPAALLLRYAPAPAALDGVPQLAAAIAAAHPALFERIDANRALDGSHLYFYCWSASPDVHADEVERSVLALARRHVPAEGAVDVLRLRPVIDRPGASHGTRAAYHYVVETDVQPAIAQDLADWYAHEHLPGLASVEGNARARRLEATNADGSIRSLACYDLLSPAVTQHPAWLAVRATDWSERVRPYFQNTLRIMCERIHLLEAETASS